MHTDILCLILSMVWLPVTLATKNSAFTKVFDSEIYCDHEPEMIVRTVLECSQSCSRETSHCGFQYITETRTCSCFRESAMTGNSRKSVDGSMVYVRNECIHVLQNSETSTQTPGDADESLICLADKRLLVLKGSNIYLYNSYMDLVTGSASNMTFVDMFQHTTPPVIGAYRDGDTIYLVTDTDDVHSYSYNNDETTTFLSTQTWQHHFGQQRPDHVDDIAFTLDSERVIYSGSTLYTINTSNSMVSTADISNNSRKNRYRRAPSANEFPEVINSACVLDAHMDIIISNGIVYNFKTVDRIWTIIGQLEY